jgi:CheY-like chemotaxis protein
MVITDLDLPGVPGREVLRRVKRSYPGVQVVILTSKWSEQEAIACFREGAADYVTKPKLRDELVPVVLRILGEACVSSMSSNAPIAKTQTKSCEPAGVGVDESKPVLRPLNDHSLSTEFLIHRRNKRGAKTATDQEATGFQSRGFIPNRSSGVDESDRGETRFTPERVITLRKQLHRLQRWEELANPGRIHRRVHHRLPVEEVIKVLPLAPNGEPDEDRPVDAFCVDISRAGCRLLIDHLLEGHWILRFPPARSPLTGVLAKVVRSRVRLGMHELGMKFVKRLEAKE